MEIKLVASLPMLLSKEGITKVLISLRGCANWSVPLLFAKPEDRVSCVEAQLKQCRLRSGFPLFANAPIKMELRHSSK